MKKWMNSTQDTMNTAALSGKKAWSLVSRFCQIEYDPLKHPKRTCKNSKPQLISRNSESELNKNLLLGHQIENAAERSQNMCGNCRKIFMYVPIRILLMAERIRLGSGGVKNEVDCNCNKAPCGIVQIMFLARRVLWSDSVTMPRLVSIWTIQ
jgi:hypothetical protein